MNENNNIFKPQIDDSSYSCITKKAIEESMSANSKQSLNIGSIILIITLCLLGISIYKKVSKK